MTERKSLRHRIEAGELVVAPGAYDPISARLIQNAGFDAVYIGGYATSAAFGMQPDLGLLSFAEMLDHASRCASATMLPVIADADTGYGGIPSVQRTVRAYEAAGIAGIHIEDQVSPKRCGHVAGKVVLPAEEMARKIAAAVEARESAEFLIIARTDARAITGFDDAVRRARLFREAGADVLFIDAPESVDEIISIPSAVGAPVLFNAAPTGKAPLPPIPELRRAGFSIVIYPVQLMWVAYRAVQEALETLKATEDPDALADRAASFGEFNDFVGMTRLMQEDERFGAMFAAREGTVR